MIVVVMTMIGLERSDGEIDALQRRADAARRSGDAAGALDALQSLLDHPCAHHQILEYEVRDEMHSVLRESGRFDEAIEAKRAAIDAGYRSSPDPEADIAGCLLASGRRAEADELYATLRDRDPDDPWLYDSAADAYQGVDDREALRWSLAGLDVALATGDHDQVAGQLLEMTRDLWQRLDEPPDEELVTRVERFVADWTRPPHGTRRWPDAPPPPVLRRCDHCGFDPDHLRPAADVPPVESFGPSAKVPMSLAWFPETEWTVAIDRWPDLLDDLPADHGAYSHRIEARLKWLTKHSPGHRLSVSPLTVSELIESSGADADTGRARSLLAAEVARTGRALPWPPARNERCWCGSGRKYKKCCGPVPPAEYPE